MEVPLHDWMRLAFGAPILGTLGVALAFLAFAWLAPSPKRAHLAGLFALLTSFVATSIGVACLVISYRRGESCMVDCNDVYQPALILKDAWDEGRFYALVGALAGALPLLLGALVTWIAASRGRTQRLLSALCIAGALATSTFGLVLARRPWLGLDLAPNDPGWVLAGSVPAIDFGAEFGCSNMNDALKNYWRPREKTEFPRVFSPEARRLVPDLDRRAAACASHMLYGNEKARQLDELLEQPIVNDRETYDRIRRARARFP